ncbi:PucR family transcriptional regulator [Ammoniphilus sp. YIM 78166]|uniref:PucR family transcriptional regulator n=1 Tax=Ammoniphilus sp. YIM 78166 TaxID=1644106 RepID=UPI00106F5124|nr:PucR family transcriptional regulator [Ammoniphilus sp. YIM 78166]
MTFTLKDALDIEVMGLAKLLAGKTAIDQRPVESISVIEIPVENFVRKNELVLTTAIGCNHDKKIFKKFVQDVMESDAAALAIATGRHVLEIPKEVIDFAEEHQFPLIEIPWEVRFADITHEVLSKLNQWKRSTLERSEELQKKLLNLFLQGASLSDAAQAIREEVGLPVLIMDKDGLIKGKSHDAGSLAEQAQGHLLQEVRNERDSSWFKQLDASAIRLSIQTANRTHGYLLLSFGSGTTIDAFYAGGEEYVLEHAVTAAALWFQRENAIQETELRLRDDFVWSLAKGEMDSWDTVLSRAKSLDMNVNCPYVCILGQPENLETLYQKKSPAHGSYDQWHQQTVRSMEEQFTKAAQSLNRLIMATFHQNRYILYLEVPMEQVNETVKQFLDRIDTRVQVTCPDLIMSWGIGENHAGVRTFSESYNDARVALEIGTRQKGPGQRSTYANTGIYRALLSLSSNPEIQELTLSTIGALIDYDQQRGLDLAHTLIAYIRNQGNVSQTSRALSLHRQSLLYRLRKIESLTGRSLEDPEDLFLLDLSMKLWMNGMMLNREAPEPLIPSD